VLRLFGAALFRLNPVSVASLDAATTSQRGGR
jgi:hypothetical protein